MKKKCFIFIVCLTAVLVAQNANDSTQIKLKPSEEYIQLNQNKYKNNDKVTGIKNYFTPDSNGAFSPKRAMLLSLITPGLGHLYVRKPLKALFYFSAEVYHIQQVWHFNNLNNYVEDTRGMVGITQWNTLTKDEKNKAIIDSTGKDIGMNYWRPEGRRNKRIWWCAGIYIMAMLDAYVDAHLSDFPESDMEFINNEAIMSRGVRFSFKIGRRGK